MNEFDLKAADWDKNPQRVEMAQKAVQLLQSYKIISENTKAFEYGCGTGIFGVLLAPLLKELILADTSESMLNALKEKIKQNHIPNLTHINLDLTASPILRQKFDLIYSSLTLHHILNISQIFDSFAAMLENSGHLVIIDLVKEDGSFHGKDFTGHKGFDPNELSLKIQNKGFLMVHQEIFFEMNKVTDHGLERKYPVFIMIAKKTNS